METRNSAKKKDIKTKDFFEYEMIPFKTHRDSAMEKKSKNSSQVESFLKDNEDDKSEDLGHGNSQTEQGEIMAVKDSIMDVNQVLLSQILNAVNKKVEVVLPQDHMNMMQKILSTLERIEQKIDGRHTSAPNQHVLEPNSPILENDNSDPLGDIPPDHEVILEPEIVFPYELFLRDKFLLLPNKK
uniref:ORF2A n=1 Tax=Euplotes crassus TaxID=5936 RepID=V9H014_EUPCR|nr:ORF2A [Moneuplotes crassus]